MMNKLLTNPNINLRKAIRLLKISGKKCLVIINQKKQLIGTLTDGDIRQSILSGQDLNKSIDIIMDACASENNTLNGFNIEGTTQNVRLNDCIVLQSSHINNTPCGREQIILC